MSYGRNPYYIYSNGKELYLDGVTVSEEVINAFLYKILLVNRREELKDRLRQGKQSWLNKYHVDLNNLTINEISQEENEIKYERQWMENNEDEFVKKLMD